MATSSDPIKRPTESDPNDGKHGYCLLQDTEIKRRPLPPQRIYHFNVVYNWSDEENQTADTRLALRVTRSLVSRLEMKGFVNSYYHDRDCCTQDLPHELERVTEGSSVTILLLTPGFLHTCRHVYLKDGPICYLATQPSQRRRLLCLSVGVAKCQLPPELEENEVLYFGQDWEVDIPVWECVDKTLQRLIGLTSEPPVGGQECSSQIFTNSSNTAITDSRLNIRSSINDPILKQNSPQSMTRQFFSDAVIKHSNTEEESWKQNQPGCCRLTRDKEIHKHTDVTSMTTRSGRSKCVSADVHSQLCQVRPTIDNINLTTGILTDHIYTEDDSKVRHIMLDPAWVSDREQPHSTFSKRYVQECTQVLDTRHVSSLDETNYWNAEFHDEALHKTRCHDPHVYTNTDHGLHRQYLDDTSFEVDYFDTCPVEYCQASNTWNDQKESLLCHESRASGSPCYVKETYNEFDTPGRKSDSDVEKSWSTYLPNTVINVPEKAEKGCGWDFERWTNAEKWSKWTSDQEFGDPSDKIKPADQSEFMTLSLGCIDPSSNWTSKDFGMSVGDDQALTKVEHKPRQPSDNKQDQNPKGAANLKSQWCKDMPDESYCSRFHEPDNFSLDKAWEPSEITNLKRNGQTSGDSINSDLKFGDQLIRRLSEHEPLQTDNFEMYSDDPWLLKLGASQLFLSSEISLPITVERQHDLSSATGTISLGSSEVVSQVPLGKNNVKMLEKSLSSPSKLIDERHTSCGRLNVWGARDNKLLYSSNKSYAHSISPSLKRKDASSLSELYDPQSVFTNCYDGMGFSVKDPGYDPYGDFKGNPHELYSVGKDSGFEMYDDDSRDRYFESRSNRRGSNEESSGSLLDLNNSGDSYFELYDRSIDNLLELNNAGDRHFELYDRSSDNLIQMNNAGDSHFELYDKSRVGHNALNNEPRDVNFEMYEESRFSHASSELNNDYRDSRYELYDSSGSYYEMNDDYRGIYKTPTYRGQDDHCFQQSMADMTKQSDSALNPEQKESPSIPSPTVNVSDHWTVGTNRCVVTESSKSTSGVLIKLEAREEMNSENTVNAVDPLMEGGLKDLEQSPGVDPLNRGPDICMPCDDKATSNSTTSISGNTGSKNNVFNLSSSCEVIGVGASTETVVPTSIPLSKVADNAEPSEKLTSKINDLKSNVKCIEHQEALGSSDRVSCVEDNHNPTHHNGRVLYEAVNHTCEPSEVNACSQGELYVDEVSDNFSSKKSPNPYTIATETKDESVSHGIDSDHQNGHHALNLSLTNFVEDMRIYPETKAENILALRIARLLESETREILSSGKNHFSQDTIELKQDDLSPTVPCMSSQHQSTFSPATKLQAGLSLGKEIEASSSQTSNSEAVSPSEAEDFDDSKYKNDPTLTSKTEELLKGASGRVSKSGSVPSIERRGVSSPETGSKTILTPETDIMKYSSGNTKQQEPEDLSRQESESQHEAEDSSLQESESSPQQESESSPQQEAEGSSQQEAEGSSQQEAEGSSQHEAEDSSQQESEGSSQQEAQGSSQQEAEGSSQQEAEGSSQHVAEDSSQQESESSPQQESESSPQQEAENSSQQEAEGSSQQKAEGSSQQEAEGSPQQEAEGSSQQEAEGSSQQEAEGSSQHEAEDSSQQESEGSSQQEAQGSSQQEAEGSSQQEAEGSSQHVAEDSSQQESESSPQQESESSPQQEAENSSQQEAEGSSQQKAEGSSQQEAEGSSQQKAEGSSQQEAEGSSQQEAEGSSQQESEGSSQQEAEGSSQQEAEGSSQQEPEDISQKETDPEDISQQEPEDIYQKQTDPEDISQEPKGISQIETDPEDISQQKPDGSSYPATAPADIPPSEQEHEDVSQQESVSISKKEHEGISQQQPEGVSQQDPYSISYPKAAPEDIFQSETKPEYISQLETEPEDISQPEIEPEDISQQQEPDGMSQKQPGDMSYHKTAPEKLHQSETEPEHSSQLDTEPGDISQPETEDILQRQETDDISQQQEPKEISQQETECISEQEPKDISQQEPECISQLGPECISQQGPECISEQETKDISQQEPEGISLQEPEDVSYPEKETAPEVIPQSETEKEDKSQEPQGISYPETEPEVISLPETEPEDNFQQQQPEGITQKQPDGIPYPKTTPEDISQLETEHEHISQLETEPEIISQQELEGISYSETEPEDISQPKAVTEDLSQSETETEYISQPETEDILQRQETDDISQQQEPKEISQHEPEDISHHEPEDTSQHEPEDISQHEPEDTSQHEPEDISQHEPKDKSQHEPEDISQNKPEDISQHEPEDISQHEPEDKSQHLPRDISQHEPEDKSQHLPRDISQHKPEDKLQHEPEDISKHEPEDKLQHEPEDISKHEPEDISHNEPEDKSQHEHEDKSQHEHEDKSHNEHEDISQHEPEDKSKLEPEDIPQQERELERNLHEEPETDIISQVKTHSEFIIKQETGPKAVSKPEIKHENIFQPETKLDEKVHLETKHNTILKQDTEFGGNLHSEKENDTILQQETEFGGNLHSEKENDTILPQETVSELEPEVQDGTEVEGTSHYDTEAGDSSQNTQSEHVETPEFVREVSLHTEILQQEITSAGVSPPETTQHEVCLKHETDTVDTSAVKPELGGCQTIKEHYGALQPEEKEPEGVSQPESENAALKLETKPSFSQTATKPEGVSPQKTERGISPSETETEGVSRTASEHLHFSPPGTEQGDSPFVTEDKGVLKSRTEQFSSHPETGAQCIWPPKTEGLTTLATDLKHTRLTTNVVGGSVEAASDSVDSFVFEDGTSFHVTSRSRDIIKNNESDAISDCTNLHETTIPSTLELIDAVVHDVADSTFGAQATNVSARRDIAEGETNAQHHATGFIPRDSVVGEKQDCAHGLLLGDQDVSGDPPGDKTDGLLRAVMDGMSCDDTGDISFDISGDLSRDNTRDIMDDAADQITDGTPHLNDDGKSRSAGEVSCITDEITNDTLDGCCQITVTHIKAATTHIAIEGTFPIEDSVRRITDDTHLKLDGEKLHNTYSTACDATSDHALIVSPTNTASSSSSSENRNSVECDIKMTRKPSWTEDHVKILVAGKEDGAELALSNGTSLKEETTTYLFHDESLAETDSSHPELVNNSYTHGETINSRPQVAPQEVLTQRKESLLYHLCDDVDSGYFGQSLNRLDLSMDQMNELGEQNASNGGVMGHDELKPNDLGNGINTDVSKPTNMGNGVNVDDAKPIDEPKPTDLGSSVKADDSKPTDLWNTVEGDDSKPTDIGNSVKADDSKSTDLWNTVQGDDSKPTVISEGTLLEDFESAIMLQSNFSGSRKPSEDLKCNSEERKDRICAIALQKVLNVEDLDNFTLATVADEGAKDDEFVEDFIGATKLEEDLTGATKLEDISIIATKLEDDSTGATTKLQDYSTDATKLEDYSTGPTKLEDDLTGSTKLENDLTGATKLEDLKGATKLEDDLTGATKLEKDSKGATKSKDNSTCSTSLEDNSMRATHLTGATKSEEDLESADKMEVCHAEQWLLPIYSGVCHAMSKPELPYLG